MALKLHTGRQGLRRILLCIFMSCFGKNPELSISGENIYVVF